MTQDEYVPMADEPPDEAAFLSPEDEEDCPDDIGIQPQFVPRKPPVPLWRGLPNYHCPYCLFASTNESALSSHMLTRHKEAR